MNAGEQKLNDLMMRAYRSLEKIEGQMLRNVRGIKLSISEIHLIDAVGFSAKDEPGRTVGEIAETLEISMPSVTAAVNKLVKKGYLIKERGMQDGRQVHVKLTRLGRKAEFAHHYFHNNMIRYIVDGMEEREFLTLLSSMEKLNLYLRESIEKGEKRAVQNEL